MSPEARIGYWQICPEVTIEVASESDDWEALIAKIESYRREGARYAVAIDPATRRVADLGEPPRGLSLDFAAIIAAKRPLANAARSSPADPGAVRLSSWPVATLLGLTGARLRCDQRGRDRKRGPGLTILNR